MTLRLKFIAIFQEGPENDLPEHKMKRDLDTKQIQRYAPVSLLQVYLAWHSG
jgi:hypothetical protein